MAFKAFQEAALADDELMSDYLGGVVAASGPEDDFAIALVALIGRLSSLQLRLHYLIYRELAYLWPTELTPPNIFEESTAPTMTFDVFGLLEALGESKAAVNAARLPGTIDVLYREGLISGPWSVKASLVRLKTSGRGADLFLWGHGIDGHGNAIYKHGRDVTLLTDVPRCRGAAIV